MHQVFVRGTKQDSHEVLSKGQHQQHVVISDVLSETSRVLFSENISNVNIK